MSESIVFAATSLICAVMFYTAYCAPTNPCLLLPMNIPIDHLRSLWGSRFLCRPSEHDEIRRWNHIKKGNTTWQATTSTSMLRVMGTMKFTSQGVHISRVWRTESTLENSWVAVALFRRRKSITHKRMVATTAVENVTQRSNGSADLQQEHAEPNLVRCAAGRCHRVCIHEGTR